MIDGKKVIAIIPARGGSKGLPGKNIKTINGLPLIAWTIKSVQQSKLIDYCMVSTNDPEIAEVSRAHGGNVPFLRPEALARDTSNPVDAVIHVLEELKTRGESFDYILLLEPTSPLHEPDDIDNMIRALHQNPATKDALTSVGEAHDTPYKMKKVQGLEVLPFIESNPGESRRQDLAPVYFPYGVGYLVKTSVFVEQRTFYPERLMPYLIKRYQCFEVDDIYDFLTIESIMKYEWRLT